MPDADARLLDLLKTAYFAPGAKLTLPSGKTIVPNPATDIEVTTEVQHHLANALDAMAEASYLEAHLDPYVARAVRAAHRAVAKASKRAARKNRE